jgi:hypothetical protein
MSRICDFFAEIPMTSPDLERHNFAPEGTSERGKEVVTTLPAMPEVDRLARYSQKHHYLNFLFEHSQVGS